MRPTISSSILEWAPRRAEFWMMLTLTLLAAVFLSPLASAQQPVLQQPVLQNQAVVKQLTPSGNATLRWRAPNSGAVVAGTFTQVSHNQVLHNQVLHNQGSNGPKLAATGKYPVQQASQIENVHPLNDPFNDRAQPVVQLDQPGQVQPAPLDQGDFPTDPVPMVPPFNPGVPADPGADPNTDPSAPANPGTGPVPMPMTPMPADIDAVPSEADNEPLRDKAALADCDEKVNNRKCCAEIGNCLEFTGFAPLKDVESSLLDITTVPGQLDDKGWKDSRTWKDCQGRDLVTGSLHAVEFGKVHIKVGDNIRKFNIDDLSYSDICFVTAWTKVPTECIVAGECNAEGLCCRRHIDDGRYWLASTFTWKASALCHKPLYFEQVQLERYGHTMGPVTQQLVDGAHFFTNVAFLPYNMGVHLPTECRYALGYYRPGSCAPWLIDPVPISMRGAIFQGAAVTGVAFIIP